MYREIIKAHERIKSFIKNIPLYYSNIFSELKEGDIYLKLENLQRTGSFKIRGALNCMLKNREKCVNGVIAASAGNHAQGVAFGAKLLNIPATIVMPEITPLIKVLNTSKYGAKVVLHGKSYDDAYNKAVELSKKENLFLIHPFEDEDVIAGQGTIGYEILNELSEIDQILVPIGGGGLISGIATYVKHVSPNTKIIGIQADNAAGMYYSHMRKKVVTLSSSATIAEGIAVKRVGDMTFEICESHVDDVITVSDDEIAYAILQLIEQSKLVVEGAGAVGIAAILSNKVNVKNKTTVVIISGGNIDVNLISRIINKGMVTTGRYCQITVNVKDAPGSLSAVTGIIASLQANILDIKHHRFDANLPVNYTKVIFDLETKGFDHIEKIISELNRAGFEARANG
ncbi:threonine ammonia-lyase [Deferribacter autotrophicus]|uniref:Threonine ammonia-lyase n=1 Tax=Deferribacter autotrophicus TaxID=500465 RepID=A0A5A8F5R4_9BACT|nr:threonine ammonia-lyase [Deferribacter autotrophicus]KAA0258855.1 threonine ammonia-lyase [Deferribacter autotrophicus]